MEFRYCPLCGNPLGTIENDAVKRWYCSTCGRKHYRNPTVGVAGVLFEKGRLLLVKRGDGVSYEKQWCIPCGHVEWGEDVREACRREFLEETGIEAAVEAVFAVHSNFHDPQHLTVGIWFRMKRIGGKLEAGSDASDVRFFPLDRIPEKMAFPTDLLVIEKLKMNLTTGRL